VALKVPPGTTDGRTLRVRGKGAPRLSGGGHGDLLACVRVMVPAKLSTEERELVEKLGKSQSDPRRALFGEGF
jgi:DnaJ-class molecular chaperone